MSEVWSAVMMLCERCGCLFEADYSKGQFCKRICVYCRVLLILRDGEIFSIGGEFIEPERVQSHGEVNNDAR